MLKFTLNLQYNFFKNQNHIKFQKCSVGHENLQEYSLDMYLPRLRLIWHDKMFLKYNLFCEMSPPALLSASAQQGRIDCYYSNGDALCVTHTRNTGCEPCIWSSHLCLCDQHDDRESALPIRERSERSRDQGAPRSIEGLAPPRASKG